METNMNRDDETPNEILANIRRLMEESRALNDSLKVDLLICSLDEAKPPSME